MKTMKKTKITTKITMRAITSVLAFAFFAMAASAVYGSGQPPMQDVPGHPIFFRQCTACLLVRYSGGGLYSWCEETGELTSIPTYPGAAVIELWNNCKRAPFQAISGGPPRPAITFPENVPPDSVRIVPAFTPIVQEPPVPPRGVWRAPLAGEPLDYSIWYGVIRSAIVMPQRELTNAELQIWVDEYWELGGMNPFEFEVVRLINEVRVSYGLNPLEICPVLSMAARYHGHQMRDHRFFAHFNPVTGSNPTYRAGLFDARMISNIASNGIVLENISGGAGDPGATVRSWLNSPGHRRAILNANLDYIGVGAGPGSPTLKLH